MARVELKDSGVIFNEEKHEYWLNGKQLSGITEMLQRQLFPDEYSGIPWQIVKKAGEYGSDVHKRIEKFDSEWINDGTQEVLDYIQICKEHGLTHEKSEYTITDGKTWASNIDKVFRVGEDTFDLADIKTYGRMDKTKLTKVQWQLSIYAYMFELVNKKAKVGRLCVIQVRNKEKKDGTYDHIAEFREVKRIPSDIVKELLAAEERGEQFVNPYSIPAEYAAQENRIRELIQMKTAADEELAALKEKILADMEAQNATTWATETMKITRKLPSTRTTFNLALFKKDYPDFEYGDYERISQVSSSLSIAI